MQPDFSKSNGLIPVIVQHADTGTVLMLAYMNDEAWKKTQDSKKVTFFSRSRNSIWVKGETSGNFLEFKSAKLDCDGDTMLVQAIPLGPVCHTGTTTCFGDEKDNADFLFYLEQIISNRKSHPANGSYTTELFAKGVNKIAQKVGEEAVELVIEAKDNDRDKFLGEAADLLFHYLILLKEKGYSLHDVTEVLKNRHDKKK